MLEVVGNDDTGVSIVYTDSNGRPIQSQSLPGLTTVTISEVKLNKHVVITIFPYIMMIMIRYRLN